MKKCVEQENLSAVVAHGGLEGKKDNPYIVDAYLKKYTEGKCVQMLHKGAYNTEIDTTIQIMEYITIQNMKLIGLHHEIYLNDPEKVSPDKLKTIVRYAIEEEGV